MEAEDDLPSSPDVGEGKHSSEMLHQDYPRDAEGRRDGDIKASITVE